ncbi:MAG: hypothetical protein KHW46_05925, partial [Clostridiales bacterium]|nr:hypothetical protein [Clostridiales bacterium]
FKEERDFGKPKSWRGTKRKRVVNKAGHKISLPTFFLKKVGGGGLQKPYWHDKIRSYATF